MKKLRKVITRLTLADVKYTPAPWEIIIMNEGFHIIKRGDVICFNLAPAGVKLSEETKANARLIAAAPNLLEALEQFVDPSSGKLFVEFEKMIRAKHRKQIESAIAKAKGL